MSDVLTLAQIEEQFQSEWVLVGDPQTSATLEVKSGTVLWHSKDRDEVYRKAVALRPRRFAVLYTGRMPEPAIILSILRREQERTMAREAMSVPHASLNQPPLPTVSPLPMRG